MILRVGDGQKAFFDTVVKYSTCKYLVQKLCQVTFKQMMILRTFARKFSNIDFFLKNIPLKDDELVMSEM